LCSNQKALLKTSFAPAVLLCSQAEAAFIETKKLTFL
jgi:hypothetical protein